MKTTLRLLSSLNQPWAVAPETLQQIADFYRAHLAGEKADFKAIERELRERGQEPQQLGSFDTIDGVAVLPLTGVLSREVSLWSFLFGGTSTIAFGEAFGAAVEDPEVRAILIDTDSPGGEVAGTQELATQVFEARGRKPIVAFTDGMMASAAYWIGSAADQVVISGDTTLVGSIGVVATHIDQSRFLEGFGLRATEIVAGRKKRVASSLGPLSDDGRRELQAMVDALFAPFVADVARNRGATEDELLAGPADGSIFVGQDAIEIGLADAVATRRNLIGDLISRSATGGGGRPSPRPSAAAEEASAGDEDMDLKTLTAEELAEARPDLVGQFIGSDRDEAVAEAAEKAAAAERERILGIEAQALPGHEELVAKLKADGKTTPEQAAVQILAAERARGSAWLDDRRRGAPAPLPASSEEPHKPKPGADIDPNLPIEDRCKAAWEKDPELRDEFRGDFDAFLAYSKASEGGRVRVLRRARDDQAA